MQIIPANCGPENLHGLCSAPLQTLPPHHCVSTLLLCLPIDVVIKLITIYWHRRPIISIIQLVNCILLSIAGIIQLNNGIHIERPAFPRYYGKFGKPEYLTAQNKKISSQSGIFALTPPCSCIPGGGLIMAAMQDLIRLVWWEGGKTPCETSCMNASENGH